MRRIDARACALAGLLLGWLGIAPLQAAGCDAPGDASAGLATAIHADLVLPPGTAIGAVVHALTRPLPRLSGCDPAARVGVQLLTQADVGARGVYPTGIDGIGVRLFVQEQLLHAASGVVVVEQAAQVRMEFVRTAGTPTGGRVDAAQLPELLLSPVAGGQDVRVTWSGAVALREATCRIADVRVDMGVVSVAALRADAASQPRPFHVELHDCPVGAHAIRYRLEAATRMAGAAASVAALDGHATARHVGIQLRDGDGRPLAFDVDHAVPLQGNDGAARMRIPMQAVYVPAPNQTPEPGSASTTVHITVAYD